MDHILALTVLVLLHSAPLLCWRLPSGDLGDLDLVRKDAVDRTRAVDRTAADDRTAEADLTTAVDRTAAASASTEDHYDKLASVEPDRVERFGILPIPNIATPILNPVILPDPYHHHFYQEPVVHLNPIFKPSPSISALSSTNDDWPRQKRRRKIKIHNDKEIWTEFPNKKHIVEIVPIKHKTKKGKALAYIVPKSLRIKKKLEKNKKISGIVLHRNIADTARDTVNDEEIEKNEENVAKYISDSEISDLDSLSIETRSYDENDKATKSVIDENIAKSKQIVYDKITADALEETEDKIKHKINDIIFNFKEKNDPALDTVIHDVLPDNKNDPEYHVHYIIHKKRQPKKQYGSYETAIKQKPSNNNNHEESFVNQHKSVKGQDDFYNHVIINENKENLYEKPYSHVTYEHLQPYNSADRHRYPEQESHLITSDFHYQNEHESDSVESIQENNHQHVEDVENYSLQNHVISNHDEEIPFHTIGSASAGYHTAITNSHFNTAEDLNGMINEDNSYLNEFIANIKDDPKYDVLDQYEKPTINHIHVYPENYVDDINIPEVPESTESESSSQESTSIEDITDPTFDPFFDHLNTHSEQNISFDMESFENNDNNDHNPEISEENSLSEEYDDIIHTNEVSSYGESFEHIIDHDNNASFDINDQDYIFPDCLKPKKKKPKKKCHINCKKSYKLTFLFNR